MDKTCAYCGKEFTAIGNGSNMKRWCTVRCYILDSSTPEPNTGCWIWIKSTRGGYGRCNIGGVMREAHRLSYEAFVGVIPDGLQIDHLCRVRCCVNPAHLEPVTAQENTARGETGKGPRSEAHKLSISRGLRRHYEDPENRCKRRELALSALNTPGRKEAAARALQTDEYRARQSVITKEAWRKRKAQEVS